MEFMAISGGDQDQRGKAAGAVCAERRLNLLLLGRSLTLRHAQAKKRMITSVVTLQPCHGSSAAAPFFRCVRLLQQQRPFFRCVRLLQQQQQRPFFRCVRTIFSAKNSFPAEEGILDRRHLLAAKYRVIASAATLAACGAPGNKQRRIS
jgi:hypothetical protein